MSQFSLNWHVLVLPAQKGAGHRVPAALHEGQERPVQRLIGGCLLLLAGCCAADHRFRVHSAALPTTQPANGVVFVANGSGDLRTVSASLGKVLNAATAQHRTWSHGFGRY